MNSHQMSGVLGGTKFDAWHHADLGGGVALARGEVRSGSPYFFTLNLAYRGAGQSLDTSIALRPVKGIGFTTLSGASQEGGGGSAPTRPGKPTRRRNPGIYG